MREEEWRAHACTRRLLGEQAALMCDGDAEVMYI